MEETIVFKRRTSISRLPDMQFGNHPYYGLDLVMPWQEAVKVVNAAPEAAEYIRPLYGSKEFIDCNPRACIWVPDDKAVAADQIPALALRFDRVRQRRSGVETDEAALKLADTPYRFRDQVTAKHHTIVVPRVSSESRPYLPAGLVGERAILQDQAIAMYDAPIWSMALITSRLHLVWIATVCGKMKTDFRYSNTLGWNTFPVPPLTENQKAELTRCAEAILLAREAHFPATIADLYDPKKMPENLRAAHDQNDETLERIYIGRRFKNDTERLEKLFDMYTKMTAKADASAKPKKGVAKQEPRP